MTAPQQRSPPRRLLRRVFERIDQRYRDRLGLVPVGPLLYVGLERHAGASCRLVDGTQLEPGDLVGRLHFNNVRAASVVAGTRVQAGIRFARLLLDSFGELAARSRDEAGFRDVHVFEGVTWLRAHGRDVGFDATPLPPGPRRWLLGAHFRLLIWAFAPVTPGAAMLDVDPHRFRITRCALLESFGEHRVRRAREPRREEGGT